MEEGMSFLLESPTNSGQAANQSQVLYSNWPFNHLFDASLPVQVFLPSYLGFPCHSVGKESACNAGDLDSVLGSGRSPGEGNGNPLQYYCLENPMDRGAWKATVYGVAKSWTRLSNEHFLCKSLTPLFDV